MTPEKRWCPSVSVMRFCRRNTTKYELHKGRKSPDSLAVRGYPETHQQCHASIKQHPCGNEKQADRMERVYSA
jgi:hypothetical protein